MKKTTATTTMKKPTHAPKAHLSDSKSRKKEFSSQELQHKLCRSFRGCATDWDISLPTVFCSGAEDICSLTTFFAAESKGKKFLFHAKAEGT